MTWLRSVGAPVAFALRRLWARPLSSLALVVALASAGGLVGWSSLTAATSQEQSVRMRLQTLPPGGRSLQVVYFTVPPESDFRARTVREAVAGFADITRHPHRIRVWHSIEPGNPLGTRIVLPDDAESEVSVDRGRLPSRCGGRICEALTLTGEARVGTRVRLGPKTTALIVGRGSLRPGLVGDRSELGRRALLVRSLSQPLQS